MLLFLSLINTKRTSTQKEKNELIILLTPRILKDTEDIGTDQSDTL